jgi:hypothetical protein
MTTPATTRLKKPGRPKGTTPPKTVRERVRKHRDPKRDWGDPKVDLRRATIEKLTAQYHEELLGAGGAIKWRNPRGCLIRLALRQEEIDSCASALALVRLVEIQGATKWRRIRERSIGDSDAPEYRADRFPGGEVIPAPARPVRPQGWGPD